MPPTRTPDQPALSADNSLGFLRLMLAVAVLYTHCGSLGGFSTRIEPLAAWSGDRLNLGVLAVQIFFVISGGLVATSWTRLQSPLRFVSHRLLRLLPAWWTAVFFTALVLGPVIYFGTGGGTGYFSLSPSAWGYVWHNLFHPRGQIGIGNLLDANPWGGEFNGSLWTLFYESACYGLILVAGAIGMLTRRRFYWLVLTAALFIAVTLHFSGLGSPRLARLCDTPGKLFVLVFITSATWVTFPEGAGWLRRHRFVLLLLASLLLASWRSTLWPAVSMIALPPLVFTLAEALPLSHWERWVGGDYSYGVYVYAYPVQQTLACFGVHHAGLFVYFLASLATSGLLAITSWRLVEAPALRFKSRVSRPLSPLPKPAPPPLHPHASC